MYLLAGPSRSILSPGIVIPDSPTDLAVSSIAGAQIDGAWTPIAGIDAQELWRSTDGVSYSKIDDLGAADSTFSDTTGAAGTRYWYIVRSVLNGVLSALTGADSAYTDSLYDTFTEGANTQLSGSTHVPNVCVEAGAYTKLNTSGTGFYQCIGGSNVARRSGTGIQAYTKNLGVSDGTLMATIRFDNADAGAAGLVGRVESEGDQWECFAYNVPSNAIYIYERVGGGATERATASVTIAALTNYTLKANFNGTTISCALDATSCSYGGAITYQTETDFGIYNAVATTNDHQFSALRFNREQL